ncbi:MULTISPECIES: roadblock/LC7 domain-containing protein [unclassified Variovorax]|uniref:roadblock/LC7 domain-containing protein n=1 Tax=unclassified Variovorax TaxID=663243 RepID=UPI003F46DF93
MATHIAVAPTQASRARSVLRTLKSTHGAIEGCAFVTSDGRGVASALGPDMDPDRFGAMCAALIALASRAAREAARGELLQLIIEGRDGPMLVTHAGLHGVLSVSAKPQCPLGRLILDARTTANSLAKIFDGEAPP